MKECMTCGKSTNNKSGFCSVKGWDSCKNVFVGEYGNSILTQYRERDAE